MFEKRNMSLTITFLALFAVTTTSAHAAGDNLLSVNYTVFIQVIIFLVALFILNRLVFKPLLALMDKRDKLTRGAMEEARQLEEKVSTIIEEYDARLAEARVQAIDERNKIIHEGQTVADGIITRSREETSALLHEAKQKLEADTQEIKEKVKSDVDNIGRDIASRLLGKEISS